MNKMRRKEIDEAIELLDQAKSIIESAMEEEQDALDNLPESLQDGERGEVMQSAIDELEAASIAVEEAMGAAGDAKGE